MSEGPKPEWEVPPTYGYAGAIESMGLVSAPLLAGVSAALIAFVLQNEGAFEWPNAALLFLLGAAFSFVASLQFTFRARQYRVTPAEIEGWWPDRDDPERREMMRAEQRSYLARHTQWARRASNGYDVALVFLLAGIVVMLVPFGGLSAASDGRVAVVVLALIATVAEVAWIVRDRGSA